MVATPAAATLVSTARSGRQCPRCGGRNLKEEPGELACDDCGFRTKVSHGDYSCCLADDSSVELPTCTQEGAEETNEAEVVSSKRGLGRKRDKIKTEEPETQSVWTKPDPYELLQTYCVGLQAVLIVSAFRSCWQAVAVGLQVSLTDYCQCRC